jgi:hypothetical protein
MVKRKNLRGKGFKYMYEIEIEQTLSQLLEKREVDGEALELRDKFIELFRKEIRNLIEQTNKD